MKRDHFSLILQNKNNKNAMERTRRGWPTTEHMQCQLDSSKIHDMDSASSISSPRYRSRHKPLVKSVRKPKKKSPVARVASILRRRRSSIRDRYEKALIQLAEKYLNVPTQGPEGLVYGVPKIPPGHSRESLIQVFNDVLEDMSSSNSSGRDASSGRTKISNSSLHSNEAISPVSGPPVDLLGDDVFRPDDFDRFLGGVCLKPLPACPADHRRYQNEVQQKTRSRYMITQELLIELDLESPRLPPTPSTPLNLSNSRPPSVDELFFSNTVKLSTRSLLSPPPSPPLSPSRLSTSTLNTASSLSDSRLPSGDDLFLDSGNVEVSMQSFISSNTKARLSRPTPPNLSDSRPPSMDELFFGSPISVDPQFPPLWPKPLYVSKTQVRVMQQVHQLSETSMNGSTQSPARRRGGEDLRVQADIQVTVTIPTPGSSPAAQPSHQCPPTCLRTGHTIPRKPVAASLVNEVEYPDQWRDYSSSTDPESPYEAFRSPSQETLNLPLIPSITKTSLMEEMQDELDKLMEDWNVLEVSLEQLAVPTEPQLSLLDTPVDDEPPRFTLPAAFQPHAAESEENFECVHFGRDLFDNVATLLDWSELGPSIAEEPVNAASRSAEISATTKPPEPVLDEPQFPSPYNSANQMPVVPIRTSSRAAGSTTGSLAGANNQAFTADSDSSFRSRMNKATLDALLDAGSDFEFQRAFSAAKKTKRESRTKLNSEFGWQRWVDREYVDPSAEVGRAARDRRSRREQARKRREEDAQDRAAESELEGADKRVRRRSNRFEVLDEEPVE